MRKKKLAYVVLYCVIEIVSVKQKDGSAKNLRLNDEKKVRHRVVCYNCKKKTPLIAQLERATHPNSSFLFLFLSVT